MSVNRFADCETPEAVLLDFYDLPFAEPKSQADALARIAELTPPPVVSEEARERAREALQRWCDWSSRRALDCAVDGVIDALGYTPAPGENCYKCGDHQYGVEPVCKRCQMVMLTDTPVSPPVVDLDANDLQVMRDRLKEWERVALDLYVDETHQIPTTVGRIVHNGSAWVLRIGGDYPLGVDE